MISGPCFSPNSIWVFLVQRDFSQYKCDMADSLANNIWTKQINYNRTRFRSSSKTTSFKTQLFGSVTVLFASTMTRMHYNILHLWERWHWKRKRKECPLITVKLPGAGGLGDMGRCWLKSPNFRAPGCLGGSVG